jgi:Protein of unknown function (DUF1501)
MLTGSRSDCEHYYRRDFLKIGSAGLLGLTLADAFRQEARPAPASKRAKAKGVILIWLGGGPSTIDMWDLKPNAPENIRGDFKPISTKVNGLSICEHLPKTAGVMDRCAVVRSLQHGITAHGPGTVYVATGHPPSPALEYPSLGSLAAHVLPPPTGVPPYVLFSQARASGYSGGAGFLGSAYNPFEVEAGAARGKLHVEGISLPHGFTVGQLTERKKLRDRFDANFRALDEADVPASLGRFQQQALDILRSDKTRRAFDLTAETDARRDNYGRTPFGQSVLTARRLIEAGARFVTVGLGGWDTHAGNFRTLQNQLLPQLDRALSAVIVDLDARGLLETTVVCCAGEFSRTPRVNNAGGRDHWARAMSVFLAGGGLQKGTVHGSTDAHGMAPAGDPCSPADLAATIFHALGIEPAHVVHTTSGRPLPIFRDGKVLEPLLT